MYAFSSVIFLSFLVTFVKSAPGYWGSTSLNPVHGLYVKPSSDGSKGDLFVAATEDNGVKSQWMVDQPVSFLPAATTQAQATALPIPYPSFSTLLDESSKQKRTVVASPVPSPPVQYAYVLPAPSSENNPTASYSYAYPVPLNPSENSATKCDSGSTASHYPYQYPLQLFYPQMMSAYSNAMTILKDAGLSDDTANSVMAHHMPPMWPPYGYPMYVLADPSAWIQNQSTTTPSTSTSASNTSDEEITQT